MKKLANSNEVWSSTNINSLVFITLLWLCMEKEMATHSSILAWRILWTEEPSGLLSMGSHRVGYNWSDLACMHALERVMATHSSILAWRIPETEEPGGLLSMGLNSIVHDWSDLTAAAAAWLCKISTLGETWWGIYRSSLYNFCKSKTFSK